MHSTAVLQKARRFYPKQIYFKENSPLRLRNSVSSNYDIVRGKGCIGEMTSMLTCLKEHEYENSFCAKEFQAFQNCVQTELKETNELQDKLKRGLLMEDSKDLSSKQINDLLHKYPQPNGAPPNHYLKRPPNITYADKNYPLDRASSFLPQKEKPQKIKFAKKTIP